MLTDTVQILVAMALGHVVNAFASYLIHFLQHQHVFGLGFHRLHLRAHHGPPDRRPPVVDVVAGHLVWAAGIGAGCGIYLLVLPQWMALLWTAQALLLTAGLYWIHAAYNDGSSWLMRVAWFRRCRRLHGIHHAPAKDFSSSCNYAIGGPLLGLAVDRVLGTFSDRAMRADRGSVTLEVGI